MTSSDALPEQDGEAPLHGVEHWAQLAEENGVDHVTLDSDIASSATSMSSSILQYRTIHGRRYHSERGNAQYWATIDEQHTEAMDINHHLLLLSLDEKLYLAPLKKDIKKVLDVGTGTGIWAIEIDDCTQDWTFGADAFDYIHLRYLYGSISDWAALFRQAFAACRPGGWVESYEASPRMESADGSVAPGSAMAEWGRFFVEGGRRLGRTFTIIDEELQRRYMEEAGFVDIYTWDFKAPIGGWARDPKLNEVGRFAQTALEQDYEGYVLYMANMVLGWDKEDVTLYCAQLRREIRSGKYHPFYRQRVVYGRKPEV